MITKALAFVIMGSPARRGSAEGEPRFSLCKAGITAAVLLLSQGVRGRNAVTSSLAACNTWDPPHRSGVARGEPRFSPARRGSLEGEP
jgi:hypothetical protein